jgi:hypothetical protein
MRILYVHKDIRWLKFRFEREQDGERWCTLGTYDGNRSVIPRLLTLRRSLVKGTYFVDSGTEFVGDKVLR